MFPCLFCDPGERRTDANRNQQANASRAHDDPVEGVPPEQPPKHQTSHHGYEADGCECLIECPEHGPAEQRHHRGRPDIAASVHEEDGEQKDAPDQQRHGVGDDGWSVVERLVRMRLTEQQCDHCPGRKGATAQGGDNPSGRERVPKETPPQPEEREQQHHQHDPGQDLGRDVVGREDQPKDRAVAQPTVLVLVHISEHGVEATRASQRDEAPVV